MMHHYHSTHSSLNTFNHVGDSIMVVFRYNDPNVAPEDKPTLAQKRRQQLERYSPNPKSYLVNAFPKSGMKKYDYVFIQT